MVARLEEKNVKQRRKAARRIMQVKLPAKILLVDGTHAFQCKICDISQTGAKLSTLEASKVPDTFFLMLSAHGTAHRSCEVVWRSAKELGIRFLSEAVEPL